MSPSYSTLYVKFSCLNSREPARRVTARPVRVLLSIIRAVILFASCNVRKAAARSSPLRVGAREATTGGSARARAVEKNNANCEYARPKQMSNCRCRCGEAPESSRVEVGTTGGAEREQRGRQRKPRAAVSTHSATSDAKRHARVKRGDRRYSRTTPTPTHRSLLLILYSMLH